MIVAVETNFLLELALQQAEVDAADAIVRMAEARQIQLVIPAFSFAEARTNLAAQSRKRETLHQHLRTEVRQLTRSRPYRDLRHMFESCSDVLLGSGSDQAKELSRVAGRALQR